MPSVLIIDNMQQNMADLAFVLDLEDYRVVRASCGTEGIELFKNNPTFEAVITDMRMTDMTGIDVVHAIRDINPDVGVILFVEANDAALYAMREGAYDCLPKPVQADKLLITLESAIRRHSLLAENKRLQADIMKKNEYLQGLHDSAEQILMELVPKETVSFPGIDVAAIYKSCDAVGGDMYDCFPLGDKLFFYLFDVSSHGILAAVLTMILKTSFDNFKYMQEYRDVPSALPELMARINDQMVHNTPPNMYATLFCGYIDPQKQTLTWLSGGHIDQYLLRNGNAVPLPSTGTVVGLFDFADFDTETISLEPGDKVFLFTDGLTDVRDGAQLLGTEQVLMFMDQYRHLPIAEAMNELLADTTEMAAGTPFDDDLTMLGLQIRR